MALNSFCAEAAVKQQPTNRTLIVLRVVFGCIIELGLCEMMQLQVLIDGRC